MGVYGKRVKKDRHLLISPCLVGTLFIYGKTVVGVKLSKSTV